jgi:5-bromo-4-chloroindolyl phosphate hydrolysis protein
MPAPGHLWEFLVQSGLVEGGTAALAFLAFVFIGKVSFLVSLGLAVGVYFGVSMLLPARKPGRLVIDGLTGSELQGVLAEGRARMARIERDAGRIPVAVARQRLTGILRTAENILADFQERPRHISEARFAFDTLLDAAVMSLDRYERFSRSSGSIAQRGREVLEGRIFPTVERGLQQLLEKLLQDDLRALNVDAAVLEQLLNLEGLADDGREKQGESGRTGSAEGKEASKHTAGADPAGTLEERQAP